MLTFQGELKLSQQRKFIVSSIINPAIDSNVLSKDVDRRVFEVRFSSHQAYSIRMASGAKSTITTKNICEMCNIGLETYMRTLMVTPGMCPISGEGISLNR